MRKVLDRYQRTLARPAVVSGRGLLSGAPVELRFDPAPASTGVMFRRSDIGPTATVRARVENVTGTNRRTTLTGTGPVGTGTASSGRTGPTEVVLVEHVLAALAGLRVDNCLVTLTAGEPPGLDGSAAGFTRALLAAGVVHQAAARGIYTVDSPVTVSHGGATLTLHPADPAVPDARARLRVSYLLDYGARSPIQPQRHTAWITPDGFVNDIAGCRTFILEEEVLALRKQGIGAATSVTDLVVFGPRGPIGNRLRFADEPARHKILDILGDLSLLGHDLAGHLVAYRSGHPLNIELVRTLTGRLAAARPAPHRAA